MGLFVCDEAALVKDEVEIAVQVNSKIKAKMSIPAGLSEAEIQELVLNNADVANSIAGKSVKKFIVIKGRLVNIVVG